MGIKVCDFSFISKDKRYLNGPLQKDKFKNILNDSNKKYRNEFTPVLHVPKHEDTVGSENIKLGFHS